MNPTLLARVDALFADLAGRAVPGLAIGLMRGDEVLLAKGYGLASLEQRTPLRADSLLRIASVSKQFTVAALLLLERAGRLSRHDDVRQHIPELAPYPHTVRLEHLMRNCSGLPDLLELLRLGGVNLDLRVDRATLLQVMARNRHLNFEPGTRFLYCNSGFALLGLVVERISGQSLGDFLHAQLFGPLGMRSTRMLVESDVPLPGLASPYLPDGKGGHRRAQHGFEHGGEGGLVSTVQDLLLWAAHLQQPAAGVPDLAEALRARVPLANGTPSPYANGLEHSLFEGLECVGHGGLWPGYRTEFLLLPTTGLSIVVISNDGGSNPYKTARDLARLLLELPAPTPPAPDAALVGRWLNAEAGVLLELSVQGERLLASQWGVSFEMQRQADGRWLPLRGAYELQILGLETGGLRLALGAGQQLLCQRQETEPPLPADLAGLYGSADSGAQWRIDGDALWAEGPLLRAQTPGRLRALTPALLELQTAGYWMQGSLLLHLQRDTDGRLLGLRVDNSRIRDMSFVKQT